MGNRKKEGVGNRLANNTIVVIIGLVASIMGIFAFISGKQGIPDIVETQTSTLPDPTQPEPTQTPELTNLYTFFPVPLTGTTRTYEYSVIYTSFNNDATEEVKETGSYTESVKINIDKYHSNDITIVGVEQIGTNIKAPCPEDFFYYVYDSNRFYIICSGDYVDAVGANLVTNKEPNLTIYSQYANEPLSIQPVYLAPFDIGKYWQGPKYYEISVQDKVVKETPIGKFENCYQFRFFLIHYEEFRYICPGVGLVAIEISSRGDFYTANLVSLK